MLRARMIFEDLTKGDGDARWERIERLVTGRETESLWLDFKEVRQPTALPNEDYLKDKLARAISGFANTEGGVLVYGIYAKDGKKGEPDAAEKITPIEKPGRFRAALEKLAVTLRTPWWAASWCKRSSSPRQTRASSSCSCPRVMVPLTVSSAPART